VTALDDMVRKIIDAQDAAIREALVKAQRVGCGVKVTQQATEFDPFLGDTYRATSTTTIEVCPDVPAGEVHMTRAIS
jgi:hypothetical protein